MTASSGNHTFTQQVASTVVFHSWTFSSTRFNSLKLTYSYSSVGNITEIIKEREGTDLDSGTFSYSY